MCKNDAYFSVFSGLFHSLTYIKIKFYLFISDAICIHVTRKHFIDVNLNTIHYFETKCAYLCFVS